LRLLTLSSHTPKKGSNKVWKMNRFTTSEPSPLLIKIFRDVRDVVLPLGIHGTRILVTPYSHIHTSSPHTQRPRPTPTPTQSLLVHDLFVTPRFLNAEADLVALGYTCKGACARGICLCVCLYIV
jgi:hypothetical protein